MEPEEIVKDLHKTPYKFTLANKLKSEIKKLDDGEFEYISSGLRRLMRKSENVTLVKPLESILS
jgi:hypothetical protein